MTTTITYDDKSVRRFMIASIIWGIVGMLVGVIAATQLTWWQMNGKFLESLTFGVKAEGSRSSPSAASARCTPTPSSSPSSAT